MADEYKEIYDLAKLSNLTNIKYICENHYLDSITKHCVDCNHDKPLREFWLRDLDKVSENNCIHCMFENMSSIEQYLDSYLNPPE